MSTAEKGVFSRTIDNFVRREEMGLEKQQEQKEKLAAESCHRHLMQSGTYIHMQSASSSNQSLPISSIRTLRKSSRSTSLFLISTFSLRENTTIKSHTSCTLFCRPSVLKMIAQDNGNRHALNPLLFFKKL